MPAAGCLAADYTRHDLDHHPSTPRHRAPAASVSGHGHGHAGQHDRQPGRLQGQIGPAVLPGLLSRTGRARARAALTQRIQARPRRRSANDTIASVTPTQLHGHARQQIAVVEDERTQLPDPSTARRARPAGATLILLAFLLAVGVAPANAYWSASGSGDGAAVTGTLAAPVDVTAPAAAVADVQLSWVAGAGGVTPDGYLVVRHPLVGEPSAACASAPSHAGRDPPVHGHRCARRRLHLRRDRGAPQLDRVERAQCDSQRHQRHHARGCRRVLGPGRDGRGQYRCDERQRRPGGEPGHHGQRVPSRHRGWRRPCERRPGRPGTSRPRSCLYRAGLPARDRRGRRARGAGPRPRHLLQRGCTRCHRDADSRRGRRSGRTLRHPDRRGAQHCSIQHRAAGERGAGNQHLLGRCRRRRHRRSLGPVGHHRVPRGDHRR